ncbi:hypothetical protein LRP50_22005 [Enterovibrio sp. ZSDZ42]|uniref:Secreted protein n=1 Tax=Enterovibrio gelatinilyticus TaxID=2899819 RepID=A0ABT5R6B0_9GAMM|nr:hypothetical protein [Enterovibrio sp. ZSDZ42]MDD1795798.1 hypothetical protein [Enterovibrio sp. ZSDZ42]
MLKNKHIIAAMLVAPILAIIAYFGVDLAVSEKPHAAKEGESYKLVASSNCRYTSGICTLENGDFKLKLRSERLTDNALVIKLVSDFPLDGAKISLVQQEGKSATPIDMSVTQEDRKEWFVDLPAPTTAESEIHLVVKAGETLYYGETPAVFAEYKTIFTEDK